MKQRNIGIKSLVDVYLANNINLIYKEKRSYYQNFFMDPEFVKAVRVTFVIILIGGVIFLFDYFRKLKDDSQKALFEACLKLAHERYIIDWNNSCDSLGLKQECELPPYFADSIENRYEEEKEDCYSKYPQYREEIREGRNND